MTEDRELRIEPGQIVRTAWLPIEDCTLNSRQGLNPVAVERAYRKYLQAGNSQFWPPPVGHYTAEGKRFAIDDGRHEFLALTMLNRRRVFVAWIEEEGL